MFRIRFHGRGGQGMKTASRIVGTAAFRQGFYAQDSPVYGAERRGAPMIAFTRFDSSPILERGVVQSPDLIAIADASLLEDPLIRPLQGLSPRGTILVNATRSIDSTAAPTVYVHDFTSLSLRYTDSASALSVALGVGAARLAGLERPFIERAVLDELQQLKLDAVRIEKNLELARACFDELPASATHSRVPPTVPAEITTVITPVYEDSCAGTASVALRTFSSRPCERKLSPACRRRSTDTGNPQVFGRGAA
jgi:pyruvate ferredoxin oxidoreductase gamma subunit